MYLNCKTYYSFRYGTFSTEEGKGVICVYSGDTPLARLPAFVKELDLKVVPWKHKELGEAIEHAAQKRT